MSVGAMYHYAFSLIGTSYGKKIAYRIYEKLLSDKKYFNALRPDLRPLSLYGLLHCIYMEDKSYEKAKRWFDEYYKNNDKNDELYETMLEQLERFRQTGSPHPKFN